MGCRQANEKGKGRRNGAAAQGVAEEFFIACLRRSNGETSSDRDEISYGDSLQRGEHFYKVGFSIPWLDFSIQVGVCFS